MAASSVSVVLPWRLFVVARVLPSVKNSSNNVTFCFNTQPIKRYTSGSVRLCWFVCVCVCLWLDLQERTGTRWHEDPVQVPDHLFVPQTQWTWGEQVWVLVMARWNNRCGEQVVEKIARAHKTQRNFTHLHSNPLSSLLSWLAGTLLWGQRWQEICCTMGGKSTAMCVCICVPTSSVEETHFVFSFNICEREVELLQSSSPSLAPAALWGQKTQLELDDTFQYKRKWWLLHLLHEGWSKIAQTCT